MEIFINQVNEIVDTFFSDYNYNKIETKHMMPYCRISVERFLLEKVNLY